MCKDAYLTIFWTNQAGAFYVTALACTLVSFKDQVFPKSIPNPKFIPTIPKPMPIIVGFSGVDSAIVLRSLPLLCEPTI